MAELLLKDEVYAVVGAAIEVHRLLGHGFLEAVYQEAMEIELRERAIPHVPQACIRIQYKNRTLKKEYCADLFCYGALVVELKALDALSGKEESQILNY